MWAITPHGIGQPVGARRISEGWQLASGETFTVALATYQDGYVLGADQASVEPPPSVSPADVQEERQRRLELGFQYDFGDARGVHHIGTTSADMIGWRDVIDYANALIDSGDTSTLISIVTDTGPAQVTALEWQAVMLQAATVRQVLWAKSFALQGMNPIPEDYANDAYWT